MQVDTSVAEADGETQSGDAATFTVDAYPNERFTGIVRQIRNAPQNVQNVVTYDAVIDVENTEAKLKPGMTANVTFIYAEKGDVLRIPNAALRFQPPLELLARVQHGKRGERDGAEKSRESARPERRMVWVLHEETPEPVPLTTGISDGTVTEVVEGNIHAGDLLVTDAPGETQTNRGTPPMGAGAFRRLF